MQRFFVLSLLATFSSAGGHLKSVKKSFKDSLTAI